MELLCIGAHPDDCEFWCGGTAALAIARGGSATFVSVTNGDRGHHEEIYLHNRAALGERRKQESVHAAGIIGAKARNLDVPDGEVYVTRELTERIIRVIRSCGEPGRGPDLVLINRPNDYHRDHRNTAQLVLDACYLLMVPLMCPDVPRLQRMPVVAYWFDRFTEGGAPFRPDVVVPIDSVIEQKGRMMAAHESQAFEWLPFVRAESDRVPPDPAGRARFAQQQMEMRGRTIADRCRELTPHLVPSGCQFAEAFQLSEYGRRVSPEELRTIFAA